MKRRLVIVLAIASLSAKAQNVLVPSKQSFEKKWIHNDSSQMNWYIVKDTSEVEIGTVTTRVVIGKATLTIITRVDIKNRQTRWVDSTVADINTLKPIRHSSYNMQRDMVLNFGNVVTGFYNDKIKQTNTPISDTVNNGYFDSNLYPALIGWLPLRNDYHQDIAIYDYNPNAKTGVLKATVKNVYGSTYLTGKSGAREVWIVTVSDDIGKSENLMTYYFDKADRKLWKQEINTEGRKMIMKAVE